MSLQVRFIRVLIPLIARSLLDKVEDTSHITVEVSLCEFATLHTCHDRVILGDLTRL